MQFILICNLVLYAPTWLTTFMSGLFHFNLRGLLYLQFCMRNNIFRLTPKVFQTPSLILLHLRGINNYKLRSDQSNYKLYPLLYEFEYKLDSYIRYTMYLFNWLFFYGLAADRQEYCFTKYFYFIFFYYFIFIKFIFEPKSFFSRSASKIH